MKHQYDELIRYDELIQQIMNDMGIDLNEPSTLLDMLYCVASGYLSHEQADSLSWGVCGGLVSDWDNTQRQACAWGLVSALEVLIDDTDGMDGVERDIVLEALVALGAAGVLMLEPRQQQAWRDALAQRERDRILYGGR